MKKLAVSIALSAVAFAASAQLAGNGSFESPSVTTSTTYGNGTTVAGWTVIAPPGGGVQWVNQSWLSPGLNLAAANGSQWVDLTGPSETLGQGLQTTFSGAAGDQYTLSFSVGQLGGRNIGPTVEFILNTALPALYFSHSLTPVANTMTWQSFSTVFTSSGTDTFTFRGAGLGSATVIGLDNVSVTPVPEPGTYALMLAGLGVVGWLARRRGVIGGRHAEPMPA